jgi:HEAT repeats
VESTDTLTNSTVEGGEPMIVLVATAFFMALLLIIPAVIEAVWKGCQTFYRTYALDEQPGREPECDRTRGDDRLLADDDSRAVRIERYGRFWISSSVGTEMRSRIGARPRHEPPNGERASRRSTDLKHLCPRCWKPIDLDACTCSSCHSQLKDYEALPFETKLLLALAHPTRETRMLAIQQLGEMESSPALAAFRDILVTEGDPEVVVAIALATARIGGREACELLSGLRHHESALVRSVAERLWKWTPA